MFQILSEGTEKSVSEDRWCFDWDWNQTSSGYTSEPLPAIHPHSRQTCKL